MTAHTPRFSFLQKQTRPLKNVGFISDTLTRADWSHDNKCGHVSLMPSGIWQVLGKETPKAKPSERFACSPPGRNELEDLLIGSTCQAFLSHVRLRFAEF